MLCPLGPWYRTASPVASSGASWVGSDTAAMRSAGGEEEMRCAQVQHAARQEGALSGFSMPASWVGSGTAAMRSAEQMGRPVEQAGKPR